MQLRQSLVDALFHPPPFPDLAFPPSLPSSLLGNAVLTKLSPCAQLLYQYGPRGLSRLRGNLPMVSEMGHMKALIRARGASNGRKDRRDEIPAAGALN